MSLLKQSQSDESVVEIGNYSVIVLMEIIENLAHFLDEVLYKVRSLFNINILEFLSEISILCLKQGDEIDCVLDRPFSLEGLRENVFGQEKLLCIL